MENSEEKPMPIKEYDFNIKDLWAYIERIFEERIVLLDGGMGTEIQTYKLQEQDYRGTIQEFLDCPKEMKNNNDLLNMTRKELVTEIHEAYLRAGADIVETNTFNGTSISQSDYGLEKYVYRMNKEAARLARIAADKVTEQEKEQPDGRWRLVAGAVGPSNRTASVSPKVEDPAFRNVTFEELVDAYYEQIQGLVDGGCHIIFIETIFDTLNAKAAVFAY